MKRPLFVLTLTTLVLLTLVACSAPPPSPTSAPPTKAPSAPTSAPKPMEVTRPTSAPMATRAPEPTKAPAPISAPTAAPKPASEVGTNSSGAPVLAVTVQRKIIKNANFNLTVESVDTAIDRLTGIAGDSGGYITSSRTFLEGGLKAATVTFAVPVDRFEETLRRVRGLALKVEQESASGQDVTDQYVDLEAQVRNLEATADRIREFLKKAQTVEEALKVNQQLSQVEKEIETIKGKLNYLGDRSAFSTITVEAREPRPTPTVTPTPTLTPTPTNTPTPTVTPTSTPTVTPTPWNPGDTVKQAVETQSSLLRMLVELLIWIAVVFLPYLIVFGVGVLVVARVTVWFTKRTSKRINPPPSA